MPKKGGESGRGVWMDEPRPSRAEELLQKEREKHEEKERRAYALRWHRVIFSLSLEQRRGLVGILKPILTRGISDEVNVPQRRTALFENIIEEGPRFSRREGISRLEDFFEEQRHTFFDKLFFNHQDQLSTILQQYEEMVAERMRTVPHILCLEKIARSMTGYGDAQREMTVDLHSIFLKEKDFSTACFFDDLLVRYATLRDEYKKRIEFKSKREDRVDDVAWFREEVQKLFLRISPESVGVVNKLAMNLFYDHFLQEDRKKQEVPRENMSEVFKQKKEWNRTFLAMPRDQRIIFLEDIQKTFIYFGSGSRMPSPTLVIKALKKCRYPDCERVPDDLLNAIIYNVDQESLLRILQKNKEALKSSVDSHCKKKLQDLSSRYSVEKMSSLLSSLKKFSLGVSGEDISERMFDKAKDEVVELIDGKEVSYHAESADFFSAYNAILQYLVYDIDHEKVLAKEKVSISQKPLDPQSSHVAIRKEEEEGDDDAYHFERVLHEIQKIGKRFAEGKIKSIDVDFVKSSIKKYKNRFKIDSHFSDEDWQLLEDIFCSRKDFTRDHHEFIRKNWKLVEDVFNEVSPLYNLGKSTPILLRPIHPNGRRKPSKGTSDEQFARSGGRGWPSRGRSSARYDVED